MGNWEKITSDPTILQIVRGYKIDLITEPYQRKINTHEGREKTGNSDRGPANVVQLNYSQSFSSTRSISEQFVPCIQKEWGNEASYKFKGLTSYTTISRWRGCFY